MTDETRKYFEKIQRREIDEFNKDVEHLNMSNDLTIGFDRSYAMLVIHDLESHLAVIDAISKELEG